MSSDQLATTRSIPESTPPPPLLLKVEEAAQLLGVGRSTMYALVLAGDVESILLGRLRRIPADALPRYVERLRESQLTSDRLGA